MQDGDHSYIRLNFNFGPGYEPCIKFPGAICLKELSFRTADTQHAAKVRLEPQTQHHKLGDVHNDSGKEARIELCFTRRLQA